MGAVSQQEFERMAAVLEEQAEKGDVTAMKLLGDLYYQGPTGKGANIAAALPWWKTAVDCGDYSLAPKVAHAYQNGEGCEQNDNQAFYYYQMAADNIYDVKSQFYVGLCYENGLGCRKNIRKALSYYELAALSGHAQAQWRLGGLLFMAKKSDGLHWICCAHLSGVQEATDALNHFISNGSSAKVINHEIKLIERDGIGRCGRNYEY